jgi:hypothetical protein
MIRTSLLWRECELAQVRHEARVGRSQQSPLGGAQPQPLALLHAEALQLRRPFAQFCQVARAHRTAADEVELDDMGSVAEKGQRLDVGLDLGSIGPADPIRILTLAVTESIDAPTPIRSSG